VDVVAAIAVVEVVVELPRQMETTSSGTAVTAIIWSLISFTEDLTKLDTKVATGYVYRGVTGLVSPVLVSFNTIAGATGGISSSSIVIVVCSISRSFHSRRSKSLLGGIATTALGGEGEGEGGGATSTKAATSAFEFKGVLITSLPTRLVQADEGELVSLVVTTIDGDI
jgi:hypothetical protein